MLSAQPSTIIESVSPGPNGAYDVLDPLKLDSMLQPDEIAMRDAARDFCQNELMPGILQANRNEVFDRDIMKVRIEGNTFKDT